MVIVLSPAKSLDFESSAPVENHSLPELLKDASELVDVLKVFSEKELGQLMKLSDKLASLNATRYHEWTTPFTMKNAKQALFTFTGDVYQGLEASTLNQTDLNFAQKHLRILSGLYGLLRPLDLMQPYRLEMGTRLETERGKNLYEFWGDKITAALNKLIAKHDEQVLINLASNEYFKSINPKQLDAEIITPIFKDKKNGTYKIISFYAKKARGQMAKLILKERITASTTIQSLNVDGYLYNKKMSKGNDWVFTRG